MTAQFKEFNFNDDVLKSKKYLIINRAFEYAKVMRKPASLSIIITRGILIAFAIPILISIIPALINYTNLDWLFGVFLTIYFLYFLFSKYVFLSKKNLSSSLSQTVDSFSSQNVDQNRLETKKLNRIKKKVIKNAALLSDGTLRDESKLDWIGSIVHILVVVYFMMNPQVDLFTREYFAFISNISLAIFDILVGGLMGSFNEFTLWVPKISSNYDFTDSIIIGSLRFFILVLITKKIVDGLKIKFEQEIWFEGNDLGVSLFIEKYFNDFSEYEGSLIIYDFGYTEEFGAQEADILFNKIIKKKAEYLLGNLLSVKSEILEKIEIPMENFSFFEFQTGNMSLTKQTYFKSPFYYDLLMKKRLIKFYCLEPLLVTNVDHIIYNTDDQKLYFSYSDGQIEDSGILLLFPFSIYASGMSEVVFTHNSTNLYNFSLEVSGEEKKSKFIKSIFNKMGHARKA